MRVFFPLYLLDTRCWHTRYRIYDRIYPINETLHNELQKACQKWNKEMDAEWEKKKELLQPPQPTPTAENAGKRD